MRTPEQVIQQCIRELCEIAEPEAAREWFSRWIRSTSTQVEYTHQEAKLREEVAKLGPHEPKPAEIITGREQYAVYTIGAAIIPQHGHLEWVEEKDRKVCNVTFYTLSLKGPLNEGDV